MGDKLRTWRRTLAGVVLANALPLVGIVLFDWGLAQLLIVYWVEITVGALRRTLEATFLADHVHSRDYQELVPHSILTPRSILGVVVFAVIVIWGAALGPSPTERTGFLFVLVYLARVGFDVYGVVGRSERFDPLDPSEADFDAADSSLRSSCSVVRMGRGRFELPICSV
ncbi:DUF6498-containing protein [Haladaptatus sp. W1]|uniref:DUF6498-containing protein n=1 Tax=Haladaptatus sp. W1 TaxID=1897478 RepID=UPI00373FDABE